MRHLTRRSLLAPLAIGIVLAATNLTVAADPTVQLSASPLSVEQLQETLDRKDVVGAIRLVELGWKYQYEQYYGGELISQILEADAIRKRLDAIARSTGKRSALVYAIPTDDSLELILVPPDAPPIHRPHVKRQSADAASVCAVFSRRGDGP